MRSLIGGTPQRVRCKHQACGKQTDGYPSQTRIEDLSPGAGRLTGGPDQRLGEEGASSPSSRARLTASPRLCTPSFVYTLRKWVRIVFSDTNSSPAISGAGRLVGR